MIIMTEYQRELFFQSAKILSETGGSNNLKIGVRLPSACGSEQIGAYKAMNLYFAIICSTPSLLCDYKAS